MYDLENYLKQINHIIRPIYSKILHANERYWERIRATYFIDVKKLKTTNYYYIKKSRNIKKKKTKECLSLFMFLTNHIRTTRTLIFQFSFEGKYHKWNRFSVPCGFVKSKEENNRKKLNREKEIWDCDVKKFWNHRSYLYSLRSFLSVFLGWIFRLYLTVFLVFQGYDLSTIPFVNYSYLFQ